MNHIYEEIPGWTSFYKFYSDVVRLLPDGSRLVEVGTYKGRSLSYLVVEAINSGKKFEIVGIDAFPWPDVEPDFLKYTEPIKDHFTYHKSVSWEADKFFEDQSIDFIFIDADHVYEAVIQDIRAFLPKMKPGAIMSGHDYNHHHPGVIRAVDEVFAGNPTFKYDATQDVWQVRI